MTARLHKMTAARAPRIGIVGAGIGGLGLAGMLSRKLPHVSLSILERANQDRDEGYGLDLDEWGQETLVRAGVFDRFWSVSRRRSDVMRSYPLRGNTPLFTKWSTNMEAESNRAALRSLLIDAMASRGHRVRHSCHVADARYDDGTGAIALISKDGSELDTFDLVIDAAGLYSPLRSLRVHDPVGTHFTGRTMIHGVIDEPEALADPKLAERLGQGTASAMGRGYGLTIQRFGAAAEDKRCSFFYWAPLREEDGEIECEIGIARAAGRASAIHTRGSDSLTAIQAWLHADMGTHFEQAWHSAVDGLSRATVRGVYSHGADTRLQKEPTGTPRLPLAMCGDSLRNIGLGGGGNLALQDALGIATVLTVPGAFCEATGRLQPATLQSLRQVEAAALERKHKHFNNMERVWAALAVREPGVDPVCRSLGDWADSPHWKLALNTGGAVLKAMHSFAHWRGGARGCDESTRLHPSVAKAMAEEQAWERA